MRKWSVATTLVLVAFFAIPATAGADGGGAGSGAAAPTAPQCPTQSSTGVTVVNISTELMLAWDLAKASAGPVPVSLAPGSYELSVYSWDAHSAKTHQAQTKEQWFLELWGAGATPVMVSAATPDLPEDVDLAGYHMGTLTITQPVTAVRAVHAAYPDEFEPHSVAPLCAVFTATATSGSEGAGDTDGEGDTNGTTGGTTGGGDTNGTTGGTTGGGDTNGTTGGTTGGSDDVGVLGDSASQSLQQLPLTGIALEAGFVALLALLGGILLLKRSQSWQSRLERRNARVWRRPAR
ncbi:MAG: hypothetical protein V3V82_01350 [Acidimicrobiia bacterium]